jgi:murein DD-endopeptidase MepM/ murein hydrolase activator NlpD
VTDGQFVRRGEVIGYMGSTGKSTGPHLHYEVRRVNALVNPLDYILPDEVVID